MYEKPSEYRNGAFKCRHSDLTDGKLFEGRRFDNCLIYALVESSWKNVRPFFMYYIKNNEKIGLWVGYMAHIHSQYDEVSPPALPEYPVEKMGSDDVTLLESREEYRGLSKSIGKYQTKRLLLDAHDVAAFHALKPTHQLYRKVAKSSSLYGLVENEETYFTFISLGVILDSDGVNYYDPIHELTTDLKINNHYKLPLKFNFREDSSPLPTPINVIIGENGVGKTRALKSLSRLAHDNRSDESALESGRKLRISVVVFSHETHQWARIRRSGFKYVPLSTTRADWLQLTRTLQEIYLMDVKGHHLRILHLLIAKILDPATLYFRTNEGDIASFVSLVETPRGCNFLNTSIECKHLGPDGEIFELSSGQRAIILFCFNLVLNSNRHSLLLIDEPENHLHPQFISLFIQALHSMLIASESVAVVATHSPFVVREVDKSGVLILKADQRGLPCLYRPTLQTLGGDVSLISDYVFEDSSVRKNYQERIDQRINACRDIEQRQEALRAFESLGYDAAAYARSLERLLP
ncbi:AAA family ATPase [Pseudomonas sp. dw_612]|uniref:ATP-dependent nuclease n=1 Tax=Pseudomonas sp. dw_612 TaxID=2720080 RepID=UPI001BD32C5B|nr:AAA family ATPase [Pseudomonas sp. dw_612]